MVQTMHAECHENRGQKNEKEKKKKSLFVKSPEASDVSHSLEWKDSSDE